MICTVRMQQHMMPTFVDHGKHAQYLDLPHVPRGDDAETDLTHVEGVVVAL